MAIRAKSQSWQVIGLLVAAIALWAAERWNPGLLREWRDQPAAQDSPPATEVSGEPAMVGGYQRYEGCEWVEHRQNDGDSFRLRLPDGRVEQFRLYFADAPESAFRTYRQGATNHQRIHEQAVDFGVTDARAVEIGQEAKKKVEALLKDRKITLFTEWTDPFKDHRYRAFVAVPGGDGWLHEWLIRHGLARVHTEGAPLPDGTPVAKQKRHLKALEKAARTTH
ncbi:endonuclease YncB(thermonuclease family) [Haloferula luteola]|uniref:Endonuclease YncB(Thermonuclease family) n=1 Tax=Haloferula luteola TaxID=595692 RepID=A0A840V416_9BACT|nr:hypothetical protein [Haloferula luteola]MBB5352755.1 endonuclease YncB(thermonuclease family) [Haloferula luteola]